MDYMVEEVAEFENFSVLGEDEVGLEIQLGTIDDDSSPSPENVPESTNQGEEVYNAGYLHGGNFGGV